MKPAIAFLVIVSLCQACTNNEVPKCNDEPGLRELAEFRIGVSVSPFEIESNEAYREIVANQFNCITPGNAFKPDALHPAEGLFSFKEAQSLLAFAAENQQDVHGHTLIWHQQLPLWMKNYQGSRHDWIDMMQDHIQNVVKELSPQVASWDVVNEAFEDNGDFRETIWFNNIGPEYIELAFEFAHEANGDALLFYNDYNIAAKPKKCRAILDHLSELKSKGVPVHGIGMQLHIYTSSPGQNKIETASEAIANEGFLLHYSEVDISINRDGGSVDLTENKLQNQAERMRFLVETFHRIPKAQRFGITVWGVSDSDSWIPGFFGREDYPLLYDGEYQPKPMYCGFREGLSN